MMKSQRTLVTTLVAAALAFGVGFPILAADTHAHAAGAAAQLALDHGRQWSTDEPLRRHMASIRSMMATRLASIHAGKASDADYRSLGEALEKEVAAIVADLVAGADIMQAKAAGEPAEGAQKVVMAANAYGRHFDHPGWTPLR